MDFKYDVIVIGAGHAGCEAAAAAANMGSKTCLITMDMNKIGQMSCNPAVGGIAKGQIVREIDALGGYMGLVTDRTAIQFRMLNRSKGPAMWSPRAQCDRGKFIWAWREILENTPNLHIWQDTVEELIVENGEATGVPIVPKTENILSKVLFFQKETSLCRDSVYAVVRSVYRRPEAAHCFGSGAVPDHPVLEGQILHQDIGEKGGEEPCLRSKTSTRPLTPAQSTKKWPCKT